MNIILKDERIRHLAPPNVFFWGKLPLFFFTSLPPVEIIVLFVHTLHCKVFGTTLKIIIIILTSVHSIR